VGGKPVIVATRDVDKLKKRVLKLQKAHALLLAKNESLEKLAGRDALTQLPNRAQFTDSLSRALSKSTRCRDQFAVFSIDLDGFKSVNDTLGHQTGDAILREVSARLLSTMREEDVVARMGGDEFCAIVSDIAHYRVAGRIANKLINALSEPYHIKGNVLQLGASIGVAIFPLAGLNAKTLLHHADVALYQAKSKGKNGFRYFTARLNGEYRQRRSIEHGLRLALKEQTFLLRYQAVVDVKTNRIVGIEALLRCPFGKKQAVLPDVFMPIAEEIGLSIEMAEWMTQKAYAQFEKWYLAGFTDLFFSVNLTSNQLLNAETFDRMCDRMTKGQVPASQIVFDLREQTLMQHELMASQHLLMLATLGFNVAIDDFGVGHSSLTRLAEMPISQLKIGRHQVKQMGSAHGASFVKSVMMLGDQFQWQVIAKGVETRESFQQVQQLGCRWVQGFYCYKPKTARAMSVALKENLVEKSRVKSK
jgi:diguanylate cyclase (GGDEF)-like protein